MRVLIACEFSGTVRDAFLNRGHDAVSCDLLPSDSPGPHYQGDVSNILNDGWDLMIAHPPCTYLSRSGARWWKGRAKEQAEALAFVRQLLGADIPQIALENPIGKIGSAIRKPDQRIQPWQFGHPESKATCLWLKGLPLLQPTDILQPPPAWVKCGHCDEIWCDRHGLHAYDCDCPAIEEWQVDPYSTGGRWLNVTPTGQNACSPSADRWRLRSLTYPGIANAMAEQWARKLHNL